ncbi:hypothetical protein AB0B01_03235 [Streptomyces sp. NPDC044571]|uniref:hypothetical protein n=1 Tax=Streptomyces sp. NPDC044571 TaxID=3155371 RepID=UPI0034020A73
MARANPRATTEPAASGVTGAEGPHATGPGRAAGRTASPLAVAAALTAIEQAVRAAQGPDPTAPGGGPAAASAAGPEQALASLLLLRAADRSVTAWARANAAGLRRPAGQITALTDLPAPAARQLGDLDRAPADDDAARLVRPLAGTRPICGPSTRSSPTASTR